MGLDVPTCGDTRISGEYQVCDNEIERPVLSNDEDFWRTCVTRSKRAKRGAGVRWKVKASTAGFVCEIDAQGGISLQRSRSLSINGE